MPLAGRGDELDLFAGTVNVMVEEVGRVVAQVKGVTDAIAHDLRTPLTRVRSHLYRALQRRARLPPIAALAEAATADLDIVLERFAALLRIAELEAGARRSGFGAVDLAACWSSVARPLRTARRGSRDRARRDRRARASHGDEQLLFEAISNLVDNAIKFAPRGGMSACGSARAAGRRWSKCRTTAPAFAADQRQAVLRRFHRGADAADVDGTGLGLSVVTAILHLHNFTLHLDDAAPGLIARLVCIPPGIRVSFGVKFISLACAAKRAD